MPNTPVLAAATGLPAKTRLPLATILRMAHTEAAESLSGLPYTARLGVALRRAWSVARSGSSRELRELVEDRIERLLSFLDELDGDENLEPDSDDEPWLAGAPQSVALDLELEADDEPSLAALDCREDQRGWSGGGRQDRELCAAAPRIDRRGDVGHGNAPMIAALGRRRFRNPCNLMVVS